MLVTKKQILIAKEKINKYEKQVDIKYNPKTPVCCETGCYGLCKGTCIGDCSGSCSFSG